MSTWKFRGCLYFLGFVLICSKHWFAKYGYYPLYEIIQISGGAPSQFLVASPELHKIFIDFLSWCFARPCVFTFLFLFIEKITLKAPLISNQYLIREMRNLPIFLIFFGVLRFYFYRGWIDWLTQISLCIYLLWLNWRLLYTQWKSAVFYFLNLLLIGFYFWTTKYVGDTNIDQSLSTFLFSTKGIFLVSPVLIRSLINHLLIAPILAIMSILLTLMIVALPRD